MEKATAKGRLRGGGAGKCLMDDQLEFGVQRIDKNEASDSNRQRQQGNVRDGWGYRVGEMADRTLLVPRRRAMPVPYGLET
jgi:hypothetical protein